MVKILVIGAGVIGLSTAINVKKLLPGAEVTIIADKFGQETTSDGAAGIFRPTATYSPGMDRNRLLKWAKDSFDHYDAICHSEEGGSAGISMLSGYQFYDEVRTDDVSLYREVSYHHRPANHKEHEMMGNKWKYGEFIITLLIECRRYIPWLTEQFKQLGGCITIGTVIGFSELAGKYDLVVNCAGLRSRELVKGDPIYPIRGQMIRAKAPWIKHFVFTGDHCWVVPGADNVIVGGTRQARNENSSVSDTDSADVWKRGCEAMPSLKKAKWDHVWVGFRPHRSPVRVEAEKMRFGNIPLNVVHNYGHGGMGVTLSWGSSVEAAHLVKKLLTRISKL